MSWFSAIEAACAAFIERAFATTFPSDLEPAQIARKLVATMEAATRGVEGALIAPGRYVVGVHEADYERLASHRTYLEREWAALLTDMAARVGIAFVGGAAVVELESSLSVAPGAVEIETLEPELRFALRMVKGVPANGLYALAGSTRVGRSKESEIYLADPSVSRAHAVIELESGKPTMRDVGSKNGTFVNGERIRICPLVAGDLVTFGKTQLLVEAGA
jgi:FHA domain-containing protein